MKKLWLVLGCMLCLSGCTKSNIVDPIPSAELTPDMNIYNRGIEIDWDLVTEDWNDIYADQADYPMAHSLEYVRDDDEETLDVKIYVQPGTTREDAAAYATEALKGLNDSVYQQDFSFQKSEKYSYGSFVSIYTTHVIVAPYDTKDDESTWIIDDTIPDMTYKEVGEELEAEE